MSSGRHLVYFLMRRRVGGENDKTLRRARAGAMFPAPDHPGNPGDRNRPLRVVHAMMPGVIQIPGDVSVGDAARLMHKEQAPCVLIKDSESSIGIITHTDIVYKVVAQGLNPDEVQTRRVMSRPVRSVEFDQPVEAVTSVMASAEVPLLVVTRDQQPIGIITARDLVSSPKRSESGIRASVRVYNKKPEGVTHPAVITQLSHLGAFVESEAVMTSGSRITLEFLLPGSTQPIAVEATVLKRGDGAKRSQAPPSSPEAGVGVRFTDVAVSDQCQISDWVVRTRSNRSEGS